MNHIDEHGVKPAQIGGSTFVYPADPLTYFYFSLGSRHVEKIIESQLHQNEGMSIITIQTNQERQHSEISNSNSHILINE